ncbi:MAG: peptide chain release factor N(5)-glutamine methyltransferase [Clostridiales bacterium]|nr:peptide chain release factor N(5)-glutamine methyltransferase [Clostridiales bacterium]
MAKNKNDKKTCSYIGGQAVLEGVMMMGKTCMATAVRDPDGEIQVESLRLSKTPTVEKLSKIPFIRGTVNMISSLVRGTKTLMRSAAVYGDDDEEPGKVSSWLAEKFKINVMDVVAFISTVLGVVLAVALFMVLPNFIVSTLKGWFPALAGTVWEFVVLGVLKLAIFLAYMALILFIPDIKRLYMYHGAEHKTITCFERGLELTVENAKSCTRIHDRCGTSFLFIVLFINIVVLSLVNWALGINDINIPNAILLFFARIGVELVLLPVIAGVSYEILKLLARFDNWFVKIFKAPGMLIQRVFTTREPEDDMLEVAITAFKKVLEMDADETVPEQKFVTGGVLSQKMDETKQLFQANGIDESDAEWIYALVLNKKRSELKEEAIVSSSEAKKIDEIVKKRLGGRPLWYIIGDTEFYDCTIKVDERALIPRPETEILAEAVVKMAEEGDKILDMCTGSGCIAISVAKHLADKSVLVTAADVSDAAIMLAKENANLNSVSINFVQTDLFDKVRGRFNLIVCNPPYIKSSEIPHLQKEVREYEPKVALDGGEDGLDFYRRIAKDVHRYLAKGGMLLLECGENQATDIINLFEKREYAIVMKDFAGVDRFLKIAF